MSHVARKPTQTSNRKPFLDRGVNGMTPNLKKAAEKDLELQKSCMKQEKIEIECEEDLDIDDYINCDQNYYGDFIDEKPFLTVDKLNRFLRNFANIRDYSLPPPEVEDLLIEEINISFNEIQEKSTLLMEEEVSEMPPPIDFDVDDFNCSM